MEKIEVPKKFGSGTLIFFLPLFRLASEFTFSPFTSSIFSYENTLPANLRKEKLKNTSRMNLQHRGKSIVIVLLECLKLDLRGTHRITFLYEE